jgi:hypothetical protein
MKAVESGHLPVVDILLSFGADVNIQNQVTFAEFTIACLSMFFADWTVRYDGSYVRC